MYNKLRGMFGYTWPYLVTGLLCAAGALAIYSGYGAIFALILIGVPAVVFLMRNPVYTIITQFVYSSVVLFFTETMGLNGNLLYFTDVLTVILFIQIIVNYYQFGYKLRILAVPALLFLMIFLLNIASSIYNQVSLINIIWGMRLNYRFLIYMIACIMFINRRVTELIWRALVVIIILQLAICSVQFFILGYEQDAIGGTFGDHGTNQLVCVFAMALIFAYLRFSEGELKQSAVWFVLISSIYICAINEGKALLVFDMVLFVVIIFQNGITLKKIFLVAGAVLGFLAFAEILGNIYPAFKDFFDLDTTISYTLDGKYWGSYINRFNGPQFFSRYLDSVQDFIGVGLGNAAESAIPALQGAYYKHFALSRYTWFYMAYYYLEGGYIGLYLDLGFYLSFLAVAYRIRNNVSKNYVAFLLGMVLIFILSTGYFLAMIRDLAYIFYLFLSIPMAIAFDEEDEDYYPSPLSAAAKRLS